MFDNIRFLPLLLVAQEDGRQKTTTRLVPKIHTQCTHTQTHKQAEVACSMTASQGGSARLCSFTHAVGGGTLNCLLRLTAFTTPQTGTGLSATEWMKSGQIKPTLTFRITHYPRASSTSPLQDHTTTAFLLFRMGRDSRSAPNQRGYSSLERFCL